jgi:hypothetical protein
MEKPEVKSVSIRFPRDIKQWVEKEAAANYRSQNAQVLAIMKDAMREQAEQREVR